MYFIVIFNYFAVYIIKTSNTNMHICTIIMDKCFATITTRGFITIDTIIVSIDGIKAETHEKIRKGLKYEKVLTNVLNFIRLRNEFSVKNQIILTH